MPAVTLFRPLDKMQSKTLYEVKMRWLCAEWPRACQANNLNNIHRASWSQSQSCPVSGSLSLRRCLSPPVAGSSLLTRSLRRHFGQQLRTVHRLKLLPAGKESHRQGYGLLKPKLKNLNALLLQSLTSALQFKILQLIKTNSAGHQSL